jgi:hypothetical protein
VFKRFFEKDVTRLRDGNQMTRCLVGYDANSLYLWALMQDMPTEHPIRRRLENGFKAERLDHFGQMAKEWLEWVAHTRQIRIRHKFNGREKRLGDRHIPVDGWDGEKVYQFHGCYFHGHECALTLRKRVDDECREQLLQRKAKTEEITAYLESLGYSVEVMRECQWRRIKYEQRPVREFVSAHCPPFRSAFSEEGSGVHEGSVTRAILSGSLFGLVQCDIQVPEELRDHFAEFQPIFKNVCVSREDAGSFMAHYCKEHDLVSQPRRSLIGSFFGREILLATPLIKWYLEHGLVITKVQQIVEYQPRACFQSFGEAVSNARRMGDVDPNKTILADSMKLIGNSAYGKCLTNKGKHHDVFYVKEDEVGPLVNKPLFKTLTELKDGLHEVELSKKNVYWNLPSHIGFFVYQYAKLRMCQFYYDLLDNFVPRQHFELAEMDTDSLYMALSADSLEAVVKPELREEFFQHYSDWFPARACDQHAPAWIKAQLLSLERTGQPDERLPDQPCCLEKRRYDKRRPGVFKEEYKGDGIVALCSKTYFCFGERGNKFSSKGLSQTANTLTKERYLDVLTHRQSGGGLNKSFRTDGCRVYTYAQTRKALSYVYLKRRVCDDGVSTLPILL